jgi:ion channel-forming bestrophin family protein
MIKYNPKDWFLFIFRLHKADTFRALSSMMLYICLYTALICFLEKEVFHLPDTSQLKNLLMMHGMIGMVISLLLVFRTNTAYDRWWEGRKLWGSLVNNSRNLAIKLSSILPLSDNTNRLFYKTMIPAYASALRNHLQNKNFAEELFDKNEHAQLLNDLIVDHHIPNQIARKIMSRTFALHQQKTISDHQLLMIKDELSSFADICGACERIHNTPIPFSYSIFLKKFVFFYIMTLPFGFVFSLSYLTIPVVAFIFYVITSMELIAEEIEDPFGEDANDLPLEKISNNIKKHVAEIFDGDND